MEAPDCSTHTPNVGIALSRLFDVSFSIIEISITGCACFGARWVDLNQATIAARTREAVGTRLE